MIRFDPADLEFRAIVDKTITDNPPMLLDMVMEMVEAGLAPDIYTMFADSMTEFLQHLTTDTD